MSSRVPRIQTVHDGTWEAHLDTRLGGGVQGVVVAIQTVQVGSLPGYLILQHPVGLLVLGRGEVLGGRALGTAPVALGHVESAAEETGVDFVGVGIDELELGVDDGAGTALVVDAEDLLADLELVALGGDGQGLEELNLSLAVDDAAGVEVGNAGDLNLLLRGVEVNHFLCVALERCFAHLSASCAESGQSVKG